MLEAGNWFKDIANSFKDELPYPGVLGSIVESIPACHAGDRGSIPRRGDGCRFCARVASLCFSCITFSQVNYSKGMGLSWLRS